jgi:hypothetical protein
MPNTTNFNWSTPADTDLVKNGASAIRTLGSAIDTSFVDFKGGTTGQVLKKTSNTDLDVEWGTASSGLTLINTTSFSAVASTNITNVFSATYDNYLIFIKTFGSSTSTTVRARLGASASFDSGSNYSFAFNGFDRANNLSNDAGNATTSWKISADMTTTSTSFNTTRMTIFNPFLAESTNFDLQLWGRQQMVARSGGGTHDLTTSYTDIQLFAGTGTISGTAYIYGLAK